MRVLRTIKGYLRNGATAALKPRSDDTLQRRDSSPTRNPSEPAPRQSDIDELLAYLPKLYPNGTAIKTYTVPEGTHWPQYLDVVTEFYTSVDKDCWTDVDYLAHGAPSMLGDEAYIAQASLADIQTMLTYCTRGERFCDGHNGSMIEKGYVLHILNRLQVLRMSLQS